MDLIVSNVSSLAGASIAICIPPLMVEVFAVLAAIDALRRDAIMGEDLQCLACQAFGLRKLWLFAGSKWPQAWGVLVNLDTQSWMQGRIQWQVRLSVALCEYMWRHAGFSMRVLRCHSAEFM